MRMHLLVVLLGFVAWVSGSLVAWAQPPLRIPMYVEQNPGSSDLSYSFGFNGDPYLVLTTPGGQQLGPLFGPGSQSRQLDGLTFADIEDGFFGTWTVSRPQTPAPGSPVKNEFPFLPTPLMK